MPINLFSTEESKEKKDDEKAGGGITLKFGRISKSSLCIYDSFLCKKLKISKPKKSEVFEDTLINQLDEEKQAALLFDRDITFETSLIKIVKNFQAIILDMYMSNALLAICYDLITNNYTIDQNELDTILEKSHRLICSFNVSTIVLMQIVANIKNQLKNIYDMTQGDKLTKCFMHLLTNYFSLEKTDKGESNYFIGIPPKNIKELSTLPSQLKQLLEWESTEASALFSQRQNHLPPLFMQMHATYIFASNKIVRPITSFAQLFDPSILSQIFPKELIQSESFEALWQNQVKFSLQFYFSSPYKIYDPQGGSAALWCSYDKTKDIEEEVNIE